MSQNLNKINPLILQTGTAVAATVTHGAFALPVNDNYTIVVNVTAATGTSPTMDLVMQHSINGGTTYVNAPIRFAQITAAGVHYAVFHRGLAQSEAAFNQAGVADTGGALAKNFTFDPAFVKFKNTVGGTNPAFTYTISLLSDARSAV